MKNTEALVHKAAEEKRAMIEEDRGKDLLKVEEIAAKHRTSGSLPKKSFACFSCWFYLWICMHLQLLWVFLCHCSFIWYFRPFTALGFSGFWVRLMLKPHALHRNHWGPHISTCHHLQSGMHYRGLQHPTYRGFCLFMWCDIWISLYKL